MTGTGYVAEAETASPYLEQKGLALLCLFGLLIVVLAPTLYCRFRSPSKIKRLSEDLINRGSAMSPDERQKVEEERAEWQRRRRIRVLGAVMGEDGRLSTTKAIGALWTLVVAYVLLALILVWPPDWGKALNNLQGPYLALLGGPIATVVLSKTIVSTRVRRGTLQKPKGDGIPRMTDLVGDDSGDTDLFDLQYVLFNLIAVGFVMTGFWRATVDGFPEVPTTLWLLTGGPAAVFVSNKAFGTNAPAIFSVDPARVKRNEQITVYGQNFTTTDRTTSSTGAFSVQINGAKAEVDATSLTSSSVRATVPPGLSSTDSAVLTVITDAGVPANRGGLLTIVQDPTVDPIAVGKPVPPGGTFTLTGAWSLGANGLTVLVDGISAATANATGNAVNVTVPTGTGTGAVDVVIIDSVSRSQPIKLTVG